MELTPKDALALRMTSLLLARRSQRLPAGPDHDVAGVVTWFGAMQAQDLNSVLWSLGARLPGRTVTDVQDALERRDAVRTWPMRGTVHLVPAEDAGWMLELMGSRTLAGAARRRAGLGIGDATADRAVDVLGAALAGGGRLTRAQCIATLEGAGISCSGQVGYHLLWYASQRGVTCIAPNVGAEQTFVLLDEWVPHPARPERDEALATMAHRYFRSHGPTTRQDFAGWTGLTAADAKRGIAAAGGALVATQLEGREVFVESPLAEAHASEPVRLGGDEILALPGFDEYLLGFKDRALMLAADHKQAIIPGGNGVFQPTLVRAGRVVATWKRSLVRGRTRVVVRPLVVLTAPDRVRATAAFEAYAAFTGRLIDDVSFDGPLRPGRTGTRRGAAATPGLPDRRH